MLICFDQFDKYADFDIWRSCFERVGIYQFCKEERFEKELEKIHFY